MRPWAALRRLPLVLVILLLLGPAATIAAGQDDGDPAAGPGVTVPDDPVFDPDLGERLDETQPEAATSEEPIDPAAAPRVQDRNDEVVADEAIKQAGWGNAADQTTQAKQAEAREDCQETPPPTSTMLGLPGSSGGSGRSAWGRLVLVVAGAALLVAAAAYVARRRRGSTSSSGPLESAATVVGIIGGIAGLAVQFVPGVGVRAATTPAATMEVKDVNARIPRLEYAATLRSERPEGEDRAEVGNVIWLEIRLEGYADKDPKLQYALYDAGPGGALLPGTAVVAPLRHGDDDVETHFVPIWVGYPLSAKFRAVFRLVDGGRVHALAETGDMRASKYRYSC